MMSYKSDLHMDALERPMQACSVRLPFLAVLDEQQ